MAQNSGAAENFGTKLRRSRKFWHKIAAQPKILAQNCGADEKIDRKVYHKSYEKPTEYAQYARPFIFEYAQYAQFYAPAHNTKMPKNA